MNSNKTSCSRCVDEAVKNGKTRGGKQRYLCKLCGKSFVENPAVICYGTKFDESIVSFIREGCGIRSTARLLAIAPSTVIRLLGKISQVVIPTEGQINVTFTPGTPSTGGG